jgi:hypothetical protein
MIDPQALSHLSGFADEVDSQTRDHGAATLDGLYAVGSLALGDWRASLSNFDVLAVTGQEWNPDRIRRLRPTVARLAVHRAHPARVAFLRWSDLADDPSKVTAPVLVGGQIGPTEDLVNPMTWHILRVSGVCMRGPEYPEVWSGDVQDWAAQRILSWWSPQMARWRRNPRALWFRRQTEPAVLEIARLSVVAASGRVVSKLEAGESLIDGARSSVQRVLKDSVGHRQGVHTSMYWGPFERKNDTLSWIQSVVDQQRRAVDPPPTTPR